jgi:type I restriction enzyme S subunit
VSGDVMAPVPLVQHFDLIAQAPGGVARLRELILTLAVQGKLVPQDQSDEPASELLKKIRAEKDRLIAEGNIKRDKPLPAIGDEDKPFELPASWTWARFAEVSINRDGERIPVSSSDRESRAKIYDYYGASGVIDKIDGYLFEKTLLLIGEDGANLINRSTPIAFLAHGKYWVNNHAHVIDATHRKLLDYLALFINSISLRPYVTGTAQPKMNQAKLNSILVAVPPLAEQSRIVTRVEELMQLCDALETSGQLEAQQHAQLVNTLLGTLTQSETPEALADNWQRIATHFDVCSTALKRWAPSNKPSSNSPCAASSSPKTPPTNPPASSCKKSAPKKIASSPKARSNATNLCHPSPRKKNRLSCRRGGSGQD